MTQEQLEKVLQDYCNEHDVRLLLDINRQNVDKNEVKTFKPQPKMPEKKYRPFNNVDELLETWERMTGEKATKYKMPHIWFRRSYLNEGELYDVFKRNEDWEYGFENYTFLDGTPFGYCEDDGNSKLMEIIRSCKHKKKVRVAQVNDDDVAEEKTCNNCKHSRKICDRACCTCDNFDKWEAKE